MIGQTLSHFKITSKLGEGGMGAVYRAEDTTLGREVAIKVLPEAFTTDSERLARFEREARVLASLNHPNIAQIYGFEEHQGQKLLVMELAQGETLSDSLRRGPLPLERTLRVATQIAEALESAHELGVIHRDLKPGNITISSSDQVKILDFGLAKALQSEQPPAGTDTDMSHSPTLTADMTRAGVLLGTAAYMSPEQAKGQAVDRRADVWAFGVVLWEMLTGEKLFEGASTPEVLASVLRQPIDAEETLPSTTPGPLRNLLKRCLERDPRTRLRDIGEARIALSTLAAGSASSPLLNSAVENTQIPAPRFGPHWAWAIAAITTLLALLAGFLWLRGTTSSAELPTLVAHLLPPAGLTIVTVDGLALSSNGESVAFVVENDRGQTALCVQRLEEDRCRPLEGTEGGRYPFWSPDGRHLGFFSASSVLRIDTEGGPPRALAPAPQARGGAWCGDRIVYAPRSLDVLFSVPAEGGEPKAVTALDEQRGETSHRHPFCSPSDDRVLLLAQTAEGGSREDDSRVYWLSLATGERRPAWRANSSAAWVPSGHLLFWQNQTLLAAPLNPDSLEPVGNPHPVVSRVAYTDNEYAAFSVSQTGLLAFITDNPSKTHSTFQVVDLTGSPVGAPSPAAVHFSARLSHDGTKVVYEAGDFSSLWIHDLVRQTASRFTLADGDHFSALWSPDDDAIIYATDRLGNWQLYRESLSSRASAELLFEASLNAQATDMSSDGRLLSINLRNVANDWRIGILNLETREMEEGVDTAFDERGGTFSPDGRWLSYVSDETGSDEVYAIDLADTRSKHLISTSGGSHPRWGPEGSRLYYLGPSRKLMSVRVDPTSVTVFGIPTPLFEIPRPAPEGSPFSVMPDGRAFLLNQLIESSVPDHITVVQNWLSRIR